MMPAGFLFLRKYTAAKSRSASRNETEYRAPRNGPISHTGWGPDRSESTVPVLSRDLRSAAGDGADCMLDVRSGVRWARPRRIFSLNLSGRPSVAPRAPRMVSAPAPPKISEMMPAASPSERVPYWIGLRPRAIAAAAFSASTSASTRESST